MEAKPNVVMRLAPENVAALWPQIAVLLRPALDLVSTHTANDVRRLILTMRVQLWVELDGVEVIAAVVTEFVDYPAGLFVRAWLAGAHTDRPMNTDAVLEALDEWREMNGAIGLEAIGRHGWLKRVPGARIEGLIMRLVS